jgi:hypothetical protein
MAALGQFDAWQRKRRGQPALDLPADQFSRAARDEPNARSAKTGMHS